MTEEKKDQRVKAPVLRAKYKSRTLDEFIEKYSRDISRSGMWIKSPKPPALGTLLKVEILLEDGSPVISAVGRVVKRREESEAGVDNPAGMGIRFLKVEEASQPTIDRIVALKGEDAGPHFDNIRTGHTVPPPSASPEHSPFFGTSSPAQGAPAESDRTMMRQMNALLGEALRQVNESAPRRDLPAQKATIMGVAAPAGMLQQAIAAGREGERKADEGPTKVATRSEIDNALEKLKTVEDEKKPEPAKAEAPKAEAPKAEAPKAEAPKAEPVKAEPVKTESPRPEPVKSEPPKAEAPKPAPVKSEAPKPAPLKVEDKKNDSDRSASRSVPPRALRAPSVPPTPPASPTRSSSPEASTPPVEAKAEPAPAPERKSEPAVKAEAKPAEPHAPPPVPEAKAEPAAAPVSLDKKPEEPKADAPKADAAPVSLDKKPDEPKAEEPKAEAAKVEEPKAEVKQPEAPAAPVSLDKKADEAKVEEKKPEAPKAEAKVEEKKPEPAAPVKVEEKAVAKVEEKKAPEAKKEPEKKPSTPPQPEGSATGLIVAIVVIAALAFAVYKFLLSS